MNDKMEITKQMMERIHDRLNKVSPVDFDCGKLCDEICCVYDSEDYPNEDLQIYLLPGEETIYENSESFELKHYNIRQIKYPFSWKDGVYTVKCLNTPDCQREIRPVQCRTFPLTPHISKEGKFQLIFDESEYPYECPLIKENICLNEDFVNETFKIWKFLLKNNLIHDLIEMDSRKRNNKKSKFKIVKSEVD